MTYAESTVQAGGWAPGPSHSQWELYWRCQRGNLVGKASAHTACSALSLLHIHQSWVPDQVQVYSLMTAGTALQQLICSGIIIPRTFQVEGPCAIVLGIPCPGVAPGLVCIVPTTLGFTNSWIPPPAQTTGATGMTFPPQQQQPSGWIQMGLFYLHCTFWKCCILMEGCTCASSVVTPLLIQVTHDYTRHSCSQQDCIQ